MIAIDLGSNTIRFVEYDGVNFLSSFEKIVKTAESIRSSGEISHSAIERISSAITEAKEHIDFNQEIVACATAAMRMAKNSSFVIDYIYENHAIEFEIIDAARESMLTSLAIKNRLKALSQDIDGACIVDIGGGSSEFFDLDANSGVSVDFGIVTISDDMMGELERFREWIVTNIDTSRFKNLLFSAGTPTTVAAYMLGMRYDNYDGDRVNGVLITVDDCARVSKELLAMSESERSCYVGVGREELIIIGIEMLIVVFKTFNQHSAIVIDDGLREGIAIDYYAKNQI